MKVDLTVPQIKALIAACALYEAEHDGWVAVRPGEARAVNNAWERLADALADAGEEM